VQCEFDKKTGRNAYLVWALAATGLLCAALLLVTAVGRSGRVYAHHPEKPVMVNSPEDAYRRWRKAGLNGRVVISISRWLNFVDINSALIIPVRNPKPLLVRNVAHEAEKQLSAKNFLKIAVLNGVAREVIHVVPETEYPDKVAAVREVEGATARGDAIFAPDHGTPRRITTLKGLKRAGEPVLLYLNASFFRYHTPEEVLEGLKRAEIAADDVVLCLSANDPDVTEAERDRLRRYADLAGGAGR
jgi:hypothetical protein